MNAQALGTGVYTPPEAARMIGMQSSTLRRWLTGYDHGGKHEAELWQPQYEIGDEGLFLGFRDLIEARIVHALRKRHIGLPTIRACILRARQIVGNDRPFSTREFKTDGINIFLEITRGLDEPQLIDLKRSQGVFKRVVEPSLKGLDFGPDGAERWWLLPGKKSIVADPMRSFGQPIEAKHGVATSVLAEAVEAEGSVARVAQIFEVSQASIRDALVYETGLRN